MTTTKMVTITSEETYEILTSRARKRWATHVTGWDQFRSTDINMQLQFVSVIRRWLRPQIRNYFKKLQWC